MNRTIFIIFLFLMSTLPNLLFGQGDTTILWNNESINISNYSFVLVDLDLMANELDQEITFNQSNFSNIDTLYFKLEDDFSNIQLDKVIHDSVGLIILSTQNKPITQYISNESMKFSHLQYDYIESNEFSFDSNIFADTLSFNNIEMMTFKGKNKSHLVLIVGGCNWKQARRLKRKLPNSKIQFHSTMLEETIVNETEYSIGWSSCGIRH